MQTALIAGNAVLGLLAAPHCAAMCGAPCAALVRDGRAAGLAFHGARLAAYAAAGAAAAASLGMLAAWTRWAPALQPVWTLLQLAMLALGAWMLWQARQPIWLQRRRALAAHAVVQGPSRRAGHVITKAALAGGLCTKAALAGGLWVGLPCGLLHSALLVAALAADPAGGAAAMAAFGLASAPGLWLAPWAMNRLLAARGRQREAMAARLAGAMLVIGAGFALGHGLWMRVAGYCLPT